MAFRTILVDDRRSCEAVVDGRDLRQLTFGHHLGEALPRLLFLFVGHGHDAFQSTSPKYFSTSAAEYACCAAVAGGSLLGGAVGSGSSENVSQMLFSGVALTAVMASHDQG